MTVGERFEPVTFWIMVPLEGERESEGWETRPATGRGRARERGGKTEGSSRPGPGPDWVLGASESGTRPNVMHEILFQPHC